MFEQYQDVMDIYDVAEALNIGKNRVYELLGNGTLNEFRIGRVWKIPKAALQKYILTQSRIG